LLEDATSLLSGENLSTLFKLQQEVANIEGVALVKGIVPGTVVSNGQIIAVDLAYVDANPQQLKEFIEESYFLTEQLLTTDRNSGLLQVALEPNADGKNVVEALEEITDSRVGLEISMAGNLVIENTMMYYLLRIIFIIPPLAVLLILTVFSLMLGNKRMAIFSIAPAGIAALWAIGTILYTSDGISTTSILVPIFTIIIGSAYGLHFISHFLDNIVKYGDDKRLILRETYKDVAKPILLATVTTVAGFASLAWTDVATIREMGVYVAIGIAYAGLISLVFLPAILSRISLPKVKEKSRENRLVGWVIAAGRFKHAIIVSFIIIAIVSAAFIPAIEVETNQLLFFKESSDIRQTFDKIEDEFGGALPLNGEIVNKNPSQALLDNSYANAILALESELEETNGVTSVISIFNVIAGISQMTTGIVGYPGNPMITQGILSQLSATEQDNWISEDGFQLVIRTKDFDNESIEAISSFVDENEEIGTITGAPILFDAMSDMVVEGQTQSLGLAITVVFLMLWVSLRRLTAALIGIIPVVITILAIIGTLSITGFGLNVVTATLAAIAVGIGIDYSIHLLSAIYYYKEKGNDGYTSVKEALAKVSRPILANALGLLVGFSAYLISPLRVHSHIAVIMWVAMLVASMAALLLVPIFYSNKGKRTLAKNKNAA